MKINLLIRGHVRNSFDNDGFRNLLRSICGIFECDIFIHTWNVMQTSRSWRRIHEDRRTVDEDLLEAYFDDVWNRVKVVMIEDEDSVVLHGNTEGNVGLTPCPVKGYKSMFYGKMKVAECAFNNAPHDETAVQTRFDILSNSFSTHPDSVVSFLQKPPENNDRIKFISNEPILGVENIYMSRVDDMYKFIRYFYFNFDEIYRRHSQTRHQEQPVFFERNNF